MPVPTDDSVGALVNTSASGPMPTSRYWLQAFWSINTCFSRIACSEPGFSLERSSPTRRTTSLRIASAEDGLPRARSSITRSSIEIAKVTPAAFSTCRSTGASRCGFVASRRSGGVLAEDGFEVADPLALGPTQRACGIGLLAQRAHRGKARGDVEHAVGPHRDHGRAVDLRQPNPPDQRARDARPPAGRLWRERKHRRISRF